MNNFFAEELRTATQKDCQARWSCGRPGELFRCGFCGHKFITGDKFRALYTNDIKGGYGNPLVCEQCNDTTDRLRDKWTEKHSKWREAIKDEFWWFERQLAAAARSESDFPFH